MSVMILHIRRFFYGVVTIEKDGNNKSALRAYKDEKEYSDEVPNAHNISLLELRGDFFLNMKTVKLQRQRRLFFLKR